MSALLKVFGKPRSGSVSVAGGRLRAGSDAEVSATVLLWHPGAKSSSSALSRNPLFRDASSMKQKLSKRGSSSTAQFEVGPDASFGSSPGIRPSGHSWLREKPSKNRLNSPLSSSSSAASSGQWKRAVAMFRDNGNLTLFGEDHAMIHAIQCSALSATDVRPVDDSLFGRSYVLGIYPKPAKAHKETSITVKRGTTAPLADKLAKAEPVFLQLATQAQLQYWLALLRIYVQPEIFGSPASVELGGTHRVFRQIDLTIYDAKSIMPMWPTDLLESPKSPRSPAVPITGLYQQASGSGGFGGGGDAVRSVSSTLGTLRQDMFDDSPSSETFGGDGSGSSRPGSRPSSRTNSRPGSRPNSRVRHNAKVSVGNIRAQDPDEGSGSSRPASQAASNADVESQNGDDASSWDEPTPGPIAGSSGAARFQHDDAISIAARSTASAKRREERELYESTNFDRYCRVRVDGELMARTSVRRSAGDTFKVDKICLRNLPEVGSLTVEVLHPTLRTSSGLAGSPSSSISKYMLLGVVEIPIDSLRRNEEIEGRFPIWSVSSFAGSNGATGSKDHDDDGKIPTSFHRGVVGELKLSIKLREETVLPLSMYEEVDRRIHAEDAAELIQGLTVTLREDAVISYLVRIYAASGTITERISSLIDRESADWGDRMEPELLFRANTLLSRSVDHLQRLLALAWLDECLGPTVRKVCNDPASERPTTSSSTGSDRFDDSRSTTQQLLSGGTLQSISSIPDGPMTTNALRKLCETMWHHIYSQRHRCPSDLRTVLHRIRTKVNERYKRCQSTRPGIQGVGAFVFLRLFCAALNAPQLYGLTPSQPSRTAQRKLLLLSKVLLALASKKTAFDQEKDWELASLNDFLRTYSSAYDDYITVVSTEPPKMSSVDVLGSRYEDDGDLQACASRRLRTLPMLHKESVPTAPYMLDRPLALASFVSYIVNTAEEKGLHIVSALDTLSEVSECDASPSISGMVGVAGADRPDPARRAAVMRRKVDEFVDICCQIEEAAGMCIEGAGYNPRPIPFDRLIVRR
ncbi:Rho GTPase activation protein [Testicularia cyperi]|uniref:Rho GTPase activation protein n=1 Tax=Testicularia cyperi TaxID=1882483 RepID=A0A317XKY1_9BASI|nr:Rho GTPase activation protein [Testicularia cyperi]